MTVSALVKFHAILNLKAEIEGGRRTPIKNGFRTDLNYIGNQVRFAVFEFDEDFLFPGNSKVVICHVLLHSEQEIENMLKMKKTDIVEGPHIIGHVTIKGVIYREGIVWKE